MNVVPFSVRCRVLLAGAMLASLVGCAHGADDPAPLTDYPWEISSVFVAGYPPQLPGGGQAVFSPQGMLLSDACGLFRAHTSFSVIPKQEQHDYVGGDIVLPADAQLWQVTLTDRDTKPYPCAAKNQFYHDAIIDIVNRETVIVRRVDEATLRIYAADAAGGLAVPTVELIADRTPN
ncbi:hypothetical protein ACFPVT_10460 [Corynebacterium choanae]|uniref:Secreted protein n=1 Tax=Corynebacterium choanae TaxID=1862358 RepID=A0A3G6J3X8_9CORY|nr:hypothetical protein [Corynebacterium choanae]AZA12775.1 hypothetical protein CCHOA_01735 [Corynebacterium choanae]